MSEQGQSEKVILRIQDHQGYAPDQIKHSMTLGDFLRVVEDAVAEFGQDAMIVLDSNERYGASFGQLSVYEDLFVPVQENEDEGIYQS